MHVPAVVSEIRRIAKSPGFRAGCSKYVLDSLDRLVTRDEMFPVWEGLPRNRDRSLPFHFLVACRDALAAWERMPRAPDKEIEQSLDKLAAVADSLADDLDRHADEIRFCRISLFAANHLAGISEAQRNPGRFYRVDAENSSPLPLHRFPSLYDKDNVVGPVLIQALLREMAQRFRAHDDGWGRHPLRPTKIRDENAERTFLAKCVVHFLRSNGGKPRWDWVARSVATMTDSDAFDGDHARKLANKVLPMFTDPGDEFSWYNQHVYPEPDDPDDK